MEKRELILAIIAVVVIAASAYFIYGFAKQAYPVFKTWSDLTESDKTDIVDVFNKIADNLKECRETQDNLCLCKDSLISMNPFTKEVSIEFFEDKSQLKMNLMYNNAKISGYEKITESTQIASTAEKSGEKSDKYALTFGKKMMLESESIVGLIPHKNKDEVLSPHILRKESKGVLYFITSLIGASADPFNEYPKCMLNRQEAIDKFYSFDVKLETENEITVDLPLGYEIFYGGKVAKLVYNKEDVKRIIDNKAEVAMTQFENNIKCSEFATPVYVSSGNKVKITRTGENFCLDKI